MTLIKHPITGFLGLRVRRLAAGFLTHILESYERRIGHRIDEAFAMLQNAGYIDAIVSGIYFGCGTIRRYGFGACQPSGNFSLASSSETAGTMITSSPCCQLTGVAT